MLPTNFENEKKNDQPSQYTMTQFKNKSPHEIKFRVLTPWISGKQVFGEKNGKPFPYRFRVGESIPVSCIGENQDGEPNDVKGFLAAIVWNYDTKQIEIFCDEHTSIKDAIVELENDPDWGDVQQYDLKVGKTGKGMETRYKVTPSGMKPFVPREDFSMIELDALFTGENPFKNYKRPTPVTAPVVSDPVDDFEAFTRRAT